MSSSSYKAIVLNERPKDEIVLGETFKAVSRPRPMAASLQPGQVLVENLYLGLDPAMRGWLNDARSYVKPVGIGEVMRGATVGRVLAVGRSSSSQQQPKLAEGSLVSTQAAGWTELAVLPESEVTPIDLPPGGQITDMLGVLGITGLTAYFGLFEIGQPRAGELVVVSGAAGATGSVVVQLARLMGCRVVAIAGADDKCAWLRDELGCEAALNYKSASFASDFRAATRDFIDVYFDNVGGEILDMALGRAKPFARFVMCGGISQYNTSASDVRGPKNILSVISMRIRMQGFIVFDYASKYSQARRDLAMWLAEGKIRRKQHVVRGGLDNAPQALRDLFDGANTGKMIVEIKPEDRATKL